jgi:hypothetical protein
MVSLDHEDYVGERQDVAAQVARWLPEFIDEHGVDSPLVKMAGRALASGDYGQLQRVEWYWLKEWPDTCGVY